MSDLYFVCEKNGLMADGTTSFCTKLRNYKIEKENERDFMITDDNGDDHWFSKENGEAFYGNWFYLTSSASLPKHNYDIKDLVDVLQNAIPVLQTEELREKALKLYEHFKYELK